MSRKLVICISMSVLLFSQVTDIKAQLWAVKGSQSITLGAFVTPSSRGLMTGYQYQLSSRLVADAIYAYEQGHHVKSPFTQHRFELQFAMNVLKLKTRVILLPLLSAIIATEKAQAEKLSSLRIYGGSAGIGAGYFLSNNIALRLNIRQLILKPEQRSVVTFTQFEILTNININ